jgi:rare lipoprotein A (peptidoglycan hydrolase)
MRTRVSAAIVACWLLVVQVLPDGDATAAPHPLPSRHPSGEALVLRALPSAVRPVSTVSVRSAAGPGRDRPARGGAAARPVVAYPANPPRVVTVGHAAPVRAGGVASWYCGHGSACAAGYPGGLYAAAGPALRVGRWRGRKVVVHAGGRQVQVTLIDWCACPRRVVDLYADAFDDLAPLGRGVLKVTVTW